jgi:hypothetical protein
MELLYSITTSTMSIWTFKRAPEVPDECSSSFLEKLEWCETRKHGRPGPDRLVFTFSRWSKSRAKAQLKLCREVQRRMDFNDTAKVAYSQEGVYMAQQRDRTEQRKAIRDAERKNARARNEIDKDSDDDQKRWDDAKRRYEKELYGDHKKAKRRARTESPVSSSAEYSEDGSAESASEEENPPPRRRPSRERRRPPQRNVDRTPDINEEIEGAIQFLREFDIHVVTPNGGK